MYRRELDKTDGEVLWGERERKEIIVTVIDQHRRREGSLTKP